MHIRLKVAVTKCLCYELQRRITIRCYFVSPYCHTTCRNRFEGRLVFTKRILAKYKPVKQYVTFMNVHYNSVPVWPVCEQIVLREHRNFILFAPCIDVLVIVKIIFKSRRKKYSITARFIFYK